MSGRALIIVVTGIIITTSVILLNIGASSTRIVQNVNNYFLRQSAQNIAQSGVNVAMRQLGNNYAWRASSSPWVVKMLGGRASVRVFDTSYTGISSAICIRSTGIEEYNTSLEKRAVSTAYVYFPAPLVPSTTKALVTLNGPNDVSNNIIIDARDHNPYSTTVNPTQGTWGIWSTASTFNQAPNTQIGGTVAPIDFAPTIAPLDTVVIRLNQTIPGGFPTSPDSALGGPSSGFKEGTLKAVAKSGLGGSQYVTDPFLLKYPLRGVTYVEMPNTTPQNNWNAGTISPFGSGILIVHNTAHNATIANPNPPYFSGLLISDDISHLHGNIWGAIIVLTQSPSGNVLGNGGASLYYSKQAIKDAVSVLSSGPQQLHIIAWYE